jgi:hypothetical protein
MRVLISKASVVLSVSLVLIFALGVTNSIAQQKIKIAGKMTGATTTLDSIIVGDVDGHLISLYTSEGVNVSTGKHKFMDGAQYVNAGYGDYVMGSGPGEGYGQMSTNGDVVFLKYQLELVTTLSPDGKPVVTFEGSYTYTKGIGKYEGIRGSGTYKAKFISRTIWVLEWEGEYFIKK